MECQEPEFRTIYLRMYDFKKVPPSVEKVPKYENEGN